MYLMDLEKIVLLVALGPLLLLLLLIVIDLLGQVPATYKMFDVLRQLYPAPSA